MNLLITDTNIFIDLEDGRLIQHLFSLSIGIGTPDLLFEDELREQHANLLERGLQLIELTSNTLLQIPVLGKKYRKTSRLDLIALAAAKQENCPLVTGDMNLRHAAKKENVEVYGTLWICERFVTQKLISIDQLEAAYHRMRSTDRRLPSDLIVEQLARLRLR